MNILYIAYSCDPYNGSEDKLGWNIPLEAAKSHNVFVLTKAAHKKNIEKYCNENETGNIQFYYADIKRIYKKIFKPPFYSGRLNIWHKAALPIAKRICDENGISIIHQIAPVEFRSIGKYYKIGNAKFVCGPIAGGQKVPKALLDYTKPKRYIETLRAVINGFYKLKFIAQKTESKCDCLMFANYETKEYLKANENSIVLSDTAIKDDELGSAGQAGNEGKPFTFLIVSRFTKTKGFNLLFDALKRLPKACDYRLNIIGYGEEGNTIKTLFLNDEALKGKVSFLGRIPFKKMSLQYSCANALVFPSFREATGSVILEAMAHGLPVITLNHCGGKVLCSDENSYLFDGKTKEDYINSLSKILLHCIQNPNEVLKKGDNAIIHAEAFTFEKKVNTYTDIYTGLLKG